MKSVATEALVSSHSKIRVTVRLATCAGCWIENLLSSNGAIAQLVEHPSLVAGPGATLLTWVRITPRHKVVRKLLRKIILAMPSERQTQS